MKILYTNCRSLLSKLDHLNIVIKDEKPHLICLTETWLNDSTPNSVINFDDYFIDDELRVDRCDTRRGIGGGLLVYARKDITIRPISDENSFNQYCKFEVLREGNKRPLNVTLIYRSPNSKPENTLELAKIIECSIKNSMIIGDFNLPNTNFFDGSTDAKGRRILEAATNSFLKNVVNFSSHELGNFLDCALADQEAANSIFNVENIGNLANSDHTLIKIEIDTSLKFNHSSQMVRNWRKGDEEGLTKHLDDIDFPQLFQNKNTNESWLALRNVIDDSITRYIPLTARRKQGDPPWMTGHVKRLVNRKNKYWKRFSKNRTPDNFDRYKVAVKQCKKGVSAAKRNFERSIAKSGNKRPFNAYVKSKTKSRMNVGPLKVNKEIISDNEEMAKVLNSYFTSVFTKESPGEVPLLDKLPTVSTLSEMVFTPEQVIKKLIALKPSSAPGPDNISSRFLKANADSMAPALAIIFNKSIREGAVPDDWKRANVTPIFKKGVKGDPGNYRPVSLTSVPCRIMESCIKDEIVDHLVTNALIKDSQHGFMKNKSCTTNLLEFIEKLTAMNDLGHPIDVVYLDFSKAFDKVPHRRLLGKFRSHGIDGKVLDWVESWLSGRQQRTVLNGESSEWTDVDSGVPQGSVLGPLAFIIFINDLDDCTKLITIMNKFADDTKCGNVIKNPNDIVILQKCLDDLTSWADKWGMSFNVTKCKVVHVGRTNPRAVYSMNGTDLKPSDAERDIGVKVHCSLRPSLQCNEAAQRANAVLGQISRAFHFRDRRVFVQLYKQYVRPHLEFSVPAWSPWTQGDRETLEKIQKRAIRMISGLKGSTYEEKLREVGILSLEDRRTKYDLVQTFKIIRGFDDVRSDTWFELVGVDPARVTRHTIDPLNIKRQIPRCEIRRNFFSQRVTEKWNLIPSEVKLSKSVLIFKKKVHNMLTEKYF